MGVLRLARETGRDARFLAGVMKKRPFQVLVQVTNRCNMRCSFCSFWKNGAPPSEELTPAEFRRVADELAELGTFLVSIEGGEPTLRKDLPEIVAAFARRHLPVVFTNGWRIDPTLAHELYDAGAAQVGVSIDYADGARHDAKRGLEGGWERAWRAVDVLAEAAPHGGRQVHVMTVVMEDNVGELEPLMEMTAARKVGHCLTLLSLDGFRRGCDGDDAMPALGLGEQLGHLWDRFSHVRAFRSYFELADRFLEEPEAMPTCRAGQQTFNIDHLGFVAPCIEKIGAPAGNVRTEALSDIWSRMHDDASVAECQACWTYCRGFANALGDGSSPAALVELATRMRSR